MLDILYHFGLVVYASLVQLVSFKNKKARLWVEGRKNLFSLLEKAFEGNTKKVAWFHCASLGEFEQARTVIESFRKKHPEYFLLLTFFSPSGYEIRKKYPSADFICYLPLDTRKNVNQFLTLVNPEIIFFVKYEFWYNFLKEIKSRNIKCILFSSIFKKEQLFFKTYGNSYKKLLYTFNKILVQDEGSYNLLISHGFNNLEIAGDTRFDRVKEISENKKEIPLIERFKNKEKLIVIGSSWPEDINIVLPIIENFPNLKVVVASHEIQEKYLLDVESKTTLSTIRYSKALENDVHSYRILIIDNIGLLSSIYQYGDFAFIGGGFGKGIHNTLEAIASGLPVIFGPKYEKFKEAVGLIKQGCAFSVNSINETEQIISKLYTNDELLATLKQKSLDYINDNIGATDKIISYCENILEDERNHN